MTKEHKEKIRLPNPETIGNHSIRIARRDLIAILPEKDVILYPYGKVKLVLPLDQYWEDVWRRKGSLGLEANISLRSAYAQSGLDISEKDGIVWDLTNPHQLLVTLENWSRTKILLKHYSQLPLGNPYYYKIPTQDYRWAQHLAVFASQIIFLQNGRSNKTTLIPAHTYPEIAVATLGIPLINNHPHLNYPDQVSLDTLPSGPHRNLLLPAIGVDQHGRPIDNAFSPDNDRIINLSSTPPLQLPSDSTLVILGATNNGFFVPHSQSTLLKSKVLAPGTSPLDVGKTYDHPLMIETYGPATQVLVLPFYMETL